MTLTTPMRLECFFFEPEQYELEQLGIETQRYTSKRPVIFYEVDNISTYIKAEGEPLRAAISSAGDEYLTDLTLEQLAAKIEHHRWENIRSEH